MPALDFVQPTSDTSRTLYSVKNERVKKLTYTGIAAGESKTLVVPFEVFKGGLFHQIKIYCNSEDYDIRAYMDENESGEANGETTFLYQEGNNKLFILNNISMYAFKHEALAENKIYIDAIFVDGVNAPGTITVEFIYESLSFQP